MKGAPAWRTFWGVLALGAMMVAALWLVPSESRAAVAQTVVMGLGGLGLWLAGKSALQHTAAAKLAQAVQLEVKPQ